MAGGLFKTLAKGGAHYLPKIAKATGNGVLRAGEVGLKNWKGVAAGVVGWQVFAKGHGLVEVASDAILGEDGKEKGLVKKLDETLRGGSEKGLGEQTVDLVLGEGATEKIVDGVQSAGEKLQEGVEAVKDTVSGVFTSTRESMQDQSWPQMSQMQNMGAGVAHSLNPFTSLAGLVGGLTGGHFPFTSVAGLVAAAFLMFGRFGWMGKIASMLLGSLAMNNLRQQNLQASMAYAAPIGYAPPVQIPQETQESSYVRKGTRL